MRFRSWRLRAPSRRLRLCSRPGPMSDCRQFGSGGGSVNSYSGSDGPTWEYADSFSSIHGKHTLGFGADYRRWRLIRNLDDDFYGDWGFNGASVQNKQRRLYQCDGAVRNGQRRGRHASRLLQRRWRIRSGSIEPDRHRRQPAGPRLQLLRALCHGSLEGYPEADPGPRPPLGLPRGCVRSIEPLLLARYARTQTADCATRIRN